MATLTKPKPAAAHGEKPYRDRLVAFYLTPHDAAFYRRVAAEGGFKSTSHLFTSILEPLARGNLSLVSFVRSGKRIQKFMESHGVEFSADWSSLKGLFTWDAPPPPIPEDPISIEQLREDLEKVVAVIADEQKQAKPHKPKKTK